MNLNIKKYGDEIYLDITNKATVLTLNQHGISLWSYYGFPERGLQCNEKSQIKMEDSDE